MSTWRVWAVTVPLLLILVAAGVAMWLWRNLSSYWSAETAAAQYVLNHTPIDHLQTYQVFTASGVEDVFEGTDAFHQEWYAFYDQNQNEAFVVPTASVLPKSAAVKQARQSGIVPTAETLGYVTSQASGTLHPRDHIVYEVVGTAGSKLRFVYVDATTGRVLWKY
ncbi:PepSY domain-containing protein [Alicyclobacillus acidiphilus]|uniref:PepSY domain-containing protein n=1 Tax=Alicyclobacillus acidiphilus TaxID=182455 RepID=UPI00082E453C|nr:PepSY domain-containing protein [Alicyclobacillus acidiphilus]